MYVCSPLSYLSCLGWATTGTSCQNWEPQGERELWGHRVWVPRVPVGLHIPDRLSLPSSPLPFLSPGSDRSHWPSWPGWCQR